MIAAILATAAAVIAVAVIVWEIVRQGPESVDDDG